MDKPLVSPFAMNDAQLEIGLGHDAAAFDDYTEAVSQAELVPSTSSATWSGIGGNSLTFNGATGWACTIAHAQDNDPQGLTDFLFDNDGKEATIRLTPKRGGRAWEANVTLSPTAIGGTAGNAAASGTTTFPVQGKPRRVPAPAPAG